MRYDWIGFLTDYGTDDEFVAVCHGVIARIAPSVRIIDIAHSVAPQDIARGSRLLADAAPYLPESVHLAVVDPGVGTARRGVVVVARDGVLVGPDNGLLLPAASALGGARTAFALMNRLYQLSSVSATFHGRDIFAPAAAYLALGVAPKEFGPSVPLTRLARLPEPTVSVAGPAMVADVLGIDRFGNIKSAATAEHLAALGISLNSTVYIGFNDRRMTAVVSSTFGDVPPSTALVYIDSSEHVAVAVNGGSAAELLGGEPIDRIEISPIEIG